MKETIIKFKRGPRKKKYTAYVKNKKTKNMDAMHKLENSEELVHKKVSFDMKRKIQRARMEKKMTQKQLAQLLQVKPQIVNNYETGKAIPDSNLINKMQRILGTKLR